VTIPWATSGIDLHLDRTSPRVRDGLTRALRDAVRDGPLRPDTRLPSSRGLARDLGIARNTVGEAYSQLVAEGWLAARQGSGTWVAERHSPTAGVPPSALPPTSRVRYDLRAGVPDLSDFPRTAWSAAARRALGEAPHDLLGYGHPRGLPQLRAALADYLSRARGVVADPDRIVVCAGFAQGLELLCEVLCSRGLETLAHEAFGHPGHRAIVDSNGMNTRTLAVDARGAVLDELGDADAVLLTPAHQFPIGVPLEPSRRRRVVEWAVDTNSVIVEDDYDGEFRYDRQAIGALQALAPEQIVYAGTASKSLAPGLRLGWLVLPAHLIDDIVEVKEAKGRLSSTFDQLALAEFIACGAYDRQVRRARLSYRRRRDRLIAALQQLAPYVHVTGIAAGLHALVELPAGQDEAEVVARAAHHGLAIEGLDAYAADGWRHRPALVIGYATPPAHAFTSAIARLCTVLSTLT
jgi:GntR family transcriptional regulator/MocR family aminotransferase